MAVVNFSIENKVGEFLLWLWLTFLIENKAGEFLLWLWLTFQLRIKQESLCFGCG